MSVSPMKENHGREFWQFMCTILKPPVGLFTHPEKKFKTLAEFDLKDLPSIKLLGIVHPEVGRIFLERMFDSSEVDKYIYLGIEAIESILSGFTTLIEERKQVIWPALGKGEWIKYPSPEWIKRARLNFGEDYANV